jgi:hypothetical protein
MAVPSDAAVVHVVAEGDLGPRGGHDRGGVSIFATAAARDDGVAEDDRYRRYEVAGAGHVGLRGATSFEAIFPAVFGGIDIEGIPSQFPVPALKSALFDHLVRWTTDGIVPPCADRIAIDDAGKIRRDPCGNAIGGVRSPYLDVPVKTYNGRAGVDYPMTEVGTEIPLAPSVLRTLYDSKDDYLRQLESHLQRLISEGWFPPYEADLVRNDGEVVEFPD